LKDKVFVHVTMHEVLRHGNVYRILKFNRISKSETLRQLVLSKNLNAYESENLTPKNYGLDFSMLKEDDIEVFCNYAEPDLMTKQFRWLKEYSEILG